MAVGRLGSGLGTFPASRSLLHPDHFKANEFLPHIPVVVYLTFSFPASHNRQSQQIILRDGHLGIPKSLRYFTPHSGTSVTKRESPQHSRAFLPALIPASAGRSITGLTSLRILPTWFLFFNFFVGKAQITEPVSTQTPTSNLTIS